jgi:hypothetical protein
MSAHSEIHTYGGRDEPPTRSDRVFRAAFFTALGALLFLTGAFFAASEIPPGPQVVRAYQGGKALYVKLRDRSSGVYSSDLWYPQRRSDKGVTTHRQELAQPGVTLYTSGDRAAAHLIDMDGQVLHSWERPFGTVRKIVKTKASQPDSHVYFRHAQVLPDGGLLVIYEGVGDTPYGYGVARLNRDSELVWFYPGRAHHQFSVAPDGRIYVLTHEFVDDRIPEFGHLQRPRLEDFLVVLSPDGEELQKVRLLTALAQSRYRHMLYTVSQMASADPLHANSVKYIDRDKAAAFAYGKEGQILLSFRETNSLIVLDPGTQEIVWGTRGPWIGQHDPDILPNGNILMFDNYGSYAGPAGVSRVIEFDPATMKIVWQYAGTAEHPLDSEIRADQQRLANGNTLITESNGGRMVEVTPRGEIAWEYVNPVRGGKKGDQIPIVAWSQRLDPSTLDPALLRSRPQRN